VASPPAKILVIEDDLHTQNIIKQILTRDLALRYLKLSVVTASDGEEGLARFRESPPDLVITDLLMPKVDGFKVVETIRADPHGKTIPVIVLSAVFRDRQAQNKLERDYAVSFQAKPFSPRALAKTVLGLLKVAPSDAEPEKGSEPVRPAPGPARPARSSVTRAVLGTEAVNLAAGREARPAPERPEKALAARPGERPAEGVRPQPATSGSLVDHPVPSLILDLFEAEAQGTLELRRGKIRKLVHLMAGHPIFVQSNQRNETLGQMLVRRGLLTNAQYTEALELSAREKIKYGEALCRLKLMSEAQVMGELLTQTRLKIEACLRWRSGSFSFQEDPAIGHKVPRCVVDPVELVLDGLKRLPDLEDAFARLASKASSPIALLPRFELHRERLIALFSRSFVEALVAGRTVAEIIQVSGDPQAMLPLDVLLQAGMIELKRASGVGLPLAHPSGEHLSLERLATVEPVPQPDAPDESMEENSAVVLVQDLKRPAIPRPSRPVDPDRVKVALQLIQATYLGLHAANHYQVLGVTDKTDPTSLQVAYSIKRKQFDLSSFRDMDLGEQYVHLEEICAAFDEAYAVLSDPARRAEYDRALHASPTSARTQVRDQALKAEELYREGESLYQAGKYAEAAAAFRRALAADEQPEYRSLAALAQFLAAGQTPEAAEEAMVDVQTVLAMDPGDLTAHIVAGKISRALGHVDEGVQHLRRALKLDPTCREAFEELEAMLRDAGQQEALEMELRRALHLLGDQDQPWAATLWHRLAKLYHQSLRQPDRARIACDAGLKLCPDDRPLQELRAELDRVVPERWPEAVLGYRSLLKSEPGQPEPIHLLCELHAKAGRIDAAYVAASAAIARRVATESERGIYQREVAQAVARRASRPLAREEWERLRHADDDPTLASLFLALTPLITRLHPLRLDDFDVKRDSLRELAQLPEAFVEPLRELAGTLGVGLPAIAFQPHLGDDIQPLGVEPSLLLVGVDALAGSEPVALRFLLARSLTLLRPGQAIAGWRPRRVLRGYILATLSSAFPELAIPDPDGQVATIKAELHKLAGLEETVRETVAGLHKRFKRLNLADWQRGIQETADRVGLLLCGDLPAAAELAANRSAEAERELLDFALSETYGELRARLGLDL
jgi:CheY-like chemotaxis protein